MAELFVVGATGAFEGCYLGGCCGGGFIFSTGSLDGIDLLSLFLKDNTVCIRVLQFAKGFLKLGVPDVIIATGFDEVVVAFFAVVV